MNQRTEEVRQVCSKDVYDLLKAFNELPTQQEQEEVLDVIYDAFYHQSYKEIIKDRTILQAKRETILLQQENIDLRNENSILKEKLKNADTIISSQSKKKLRAVKKGLLIIVNNLKHYLGESWDSIFPAGMENVEAFLRNIDTEGVMKMDTWTRYEPVYEGNCAVERPYENYGENIF